MNNMDSEKVFDYFAKISEIPRSSGNMRGISDYIYRECKELADTVIQDEFLNVIAVSDATPGMENQPAIMFQGHMDMVAEKTPESTHDFLKDPIELKTEGDFLMANQTTLGADDGVAVAFMLSLLAKRNWPHPRLEMVFTVNEETGMDGAQGIDLSFSKAKYLLNLDSDEEGLFIVACAGGVSVRAHLPIRKESYRGFLYELTILTDKGGHSGSEIHLERPNTNLLAGTILYELQKQKIDFRPVSLSGGKVENAICSRTDLILVSREECDEALKKIEKLLQEEFADTDDTVTIRFTKKPKDTLEAWTENTFADVAKFLLLLPNGPMNFSRSLGTVETSLSCGIIENKENELIVHSYLRSSSELRQKRLADKVAVLTELCGGNAEFSGSYSGWAYKKDSFLRETSISVWDEMYPDKKATAKSIHAGLECGLFLQKKEDLDIISMGPTAFDIHTPKERLSISSANRCYRFILELIKKLCP